MNSKLTDELSGFYAAYSAWVNAGAQPGKIFGRANGLCMNAYDYFSAIGVDSKPHLEAMHAAFVAAGLDEKLPFNARLEQYAQEQRSVGCYLNPARLAWVASALQERRNNDESVFPGVMRCQICDFSRTHINVTPTGNYAGQSVQEDCPNGCGPLCADTYKRQYESLYDHYQLMDTEYKRDLRELQERRKFDQAKLINKFYERYPLDTFKSDSERAEALGYYMAGAELQRCGEFIVYEDANCDE